MKNPILDRLTRTGRLNRRLGEILADVRASKLARMEAGDAIGRQITAEIEARPTRGADEHRLLFEAELARAHLYHSSAGATPLEAAESLLRAREADRALGETQGERLLEDLPGILDALMEIGSRRTAMACWRVMRDVCDRRPAGDPLRADALAAFDRMLARRPIAAPAADAVVALVELLDWDDLAGSARLDLLLRRLPDLLDEAVDELDGDVLGAALAEARKRDLDFAPDLDVRVMRRLLLEGRVDADARLFYRRALERGGADVAREIESALRVAAHVQRADDPHDPDLEALNALTCELVPDAHWAWENRAELFRRKDDPCGAIACLAPTLAVSGPPPRLLGLVAPVLVRLGFHRSAREFARFLDRREKRRLRLDVIDLMAAVPRTRVGERKLAFRIACRLDDPNLPPELAVEARRRRAQLLLASGDDQEARRQFERILQQRPHDAESALGLIALDVELGRFDDARRRMKGDFGARGLPELELARARIAEAEGDAAAALAHAVAGVAALPAAQGAGREERIKALQALGHRIERMHGAAFVDGALMAMLSMDAHAAPHPGLDRLAEALDRTCARLALMLGRADEARAAIGRLRRRGLPVTDLVAPAAQAALAARDAESARAGLDAVEAAVGETCSEVALARAVLAARAGDAAGAESLLRERLEAGEARAAAPLALLLLDADRADEAAAILAEVPDDDPMAAAVRALAAERASDVIGAIAAWRGAARAPGLAERARRRAGRLAAASGLAEGDVERLELGARLLAEAGDPADVVLLGRARAALAPTPDAAAGLLERHEKRLDARHARPLKRDRLERLVEAGRFDEALALARDLAASEPGDAALQKLAAWIGRRCVLGRLLATDAGDAAAFDRAAEELRELDAADPGPLAVAAASIVARFGAGDQPVKGVRRDAPDELVVAAALAALDMRCPPAVERGLKRVAAADGDLAAAAGLLLALREDRDDLDPAPLVDLARRRGLPSPLDAADLERRALVRALAAADAAGLEALHASAGTLPDDLEAWFELARIVRSARPVPINRALAALAACRRHVAGPELDDLRARLLGRSAAILETPSPEWATTRLRTAGKRTRAFLPAVLEYWRPLRRADDDGEPWLQTAQLLLAGAHEAEIARRADGPWADAHAAWDALCGHEAFWTGLAARHDPKVTAEVRAALPRDLLDAHFRRAESLLADNRHADAVRHVRLAVTSPLARRVGRPVLEERAFAVLARDFETRVARKRYVEALEILDRVLVADRDNVRARREAVRTAAEALRQPFAMIDSFTRAPDESMLAELAALARPLASYADRCVDAFLEARGGRDLLDEDAALCLRGRAFLALRDDEPARAGEAAERALAILPGGSGLERGLRDLAATAGLESVCATLDGAEDEGGEVLADALRKLDAMIAGHPTDGRLVVRKIAVLRAAGREDDAEGLARELFESARARGEEPLAREAVELLHALQNDRGEGRLKSRLAMVDDLCRQKSWRAAHQMFRDAVAGRENEPEHLLKHAEILIGLRKVRQAEERLQRLGSYPAHDARRQLLEARLSLLKHAAARGGDVYAAFELWEREEIERALALLAELAPADAEHPVARVLVPLCRLKRGGDCEPQLRRARREADEKGLPWMKRLLDDAERRRREPETA